ncbi:hypothetical protein OSCT_2456 [Oscillochloris trichoides DG-6]|uniref:Uncharacterized protein n=1 Tax=Oscillochloris trichoides DG-6 TaxID=765420 RepID=E1IGK5_9CHLR|nr:hypothetical protein [Oscillochloris trichoides]EFO79674.1 hypothetical protein OSCT_2456 [Oscillochloris trichoides DG-6]
MQAFNTTTPFSPPRYGRPTLIFFCDLDAPELLALLDQPGVLDELTIQGYGVALAIRDLNFALVAAVRRLNQHRIPLVAWLQLPHHEGSWFHLQNYPQAVERYRSVHRWAKEHGLSFQVIGIDIEPPASELDRMQRWGLRDLTRRLWLAHENVLFAAARAAYTDLVGEIHSDGYEVHAYQLPALIDDRRAGTTVIQRAFDIVGIPADVEVVMCYSSVPIDSLGNDMGGALISSYGPSADSIGVGAVNSIALSSAPDDLPPLPGSALERDLLLAAHYTDLIYIASLEGCVERGLLPHISRINWETEVQVGLPRQLVITLLRTVLLIGLLISRFSGGLFAWMGWGLFLLLLVRQTRHAMRQKPVPPR